MKKLVYMAVLTLLSAAGIFWSCQKDETLTNSEEGLMLKSASSCCFEAPYEYDYDFSWGKNNGSFNVTSWNDDFNLYIEISSSEEITLSTDTKVSFPYRNKDNGKGIKYDTNEPESQGDKLVFSLPLTMLGDWTYCQDISFGLKIESSTQVQEVSYNQTLTETCKSCDDASFGYVTSDNMNITFSYNHDSEAEVTLRFTFPQVENLALNENEEYEAPDGKTYSVNNPKNQTNFTWTGEISCKASEPTTFEFSFVPDCGSVNAKDEQAVIWTDTKIIAIDGEQVITTEDDPSTPDIDETVIGYSIKGDLSNIVYTGCSN
ncbi:hypothetical protein [Draconibacterium mangrovi]|uniref:hypothetical protein n=1 Tax=Draconibacterium mangrovi TaxID=2697469 RepID=UPI0013D5CDBA|nr:hypothetical protein [Draconibacterium mangrovi]